jgi:hypothetical protein
MFGGQGHQPANDQRQALAAIHLGIDLVVDDKTGAFPPLRAGNIPGHDLGRNIDQLAGESIAQHI